MLERALKTSDEAKAIVCMQAVFNLRFPRHNISSQISNDGQFIQMKSSLARIAGIHHFLIIDEYVLTDNIKAIMVKMAI